MGADVGLVAGAAAVAAEAAAIRCCCCRVTAAVRRFRIRSAAAADSWLIALTLSRRIAWQKIIGTARISPSHVVTSASEIPTASSSGRAAFFECPSTLNELIIPMTVPRSPSIGPTVATTPTQLTR